MRFGIVVIGEDHQAQMELYSANTPITDKRCDRIEQALLRSQEVFRSFPRQVCPEFDLSKYEAKLAKTPYRKGWLKESVAAEKDPETRDYIFAEFDDYTPFETFTLKRRENGQVIRVSSARKGEIDWREYQDKRAEYRLARWYKAWAETGDDERSAWRRLAYYGIHAGETCDEYISWCDMLPGCAILRDDIFIEDMDIESKNKLGPPLPSEYRTEINQYPMWDRYGCHVFRTLGDDEWVTYYSCHK